MPHLFSFPDMLKRGNTVYNMLSSELSFNIHAYKEQCLLLCTFPYALQRSQSALILQANICKR